MDFTSLARLFLERRARRFDSWTGKEVEVQEAQLRSLLRSACTTAFGREHSFNDILSSSDLCSSYSEAVAAEGYESFRPYVMRMTDGEPDVLWPGICNNFAQSSGTSGGRSKFIPITRESLRLNHYAGASDVVASYLHLNPASRMFSGKGFILGGSFESQLVPKNPRAKVGDLSATLIDSVSPLVNLFRVPDKKTALMADWSEKLEMLALKASKANITNISGVPSWFLRVLQRVLEITGKPDIHRVWPSLEVFFHGGVSFEPYRAEYSAICRQTDDNLPAMNFFETYNASEGFFAVQADLLPGHRPMRLLLDIGIYYEFAPLDDENKIIGVSGLEVGRVYELIISACNGLWRYRIGDTVQVESVSPLLITIAGRTRSFINAFGEEVMEHNAEEAVGAACSETGAKIINYTVAPIYSRDGKRGSHQWIIEWSKEPEDTSLFRDILDRALCNANSDYAAKRNGSIFLDPPVIVSVPSGSFDYWLSHTSSGKLGGQRKIPRLNNDRRIADQILGSI
ncbi:MAG: GH3 auxin-responsive promoter family protein [Muribaculaceae bacterium]|nr:GH3 auxin-responsive promoter family protein [Muribaculaceae bacterium]